MSYQYLPLTLWLQTVDDFGMDVGEAKQTLNEELIHAQVGDKLKNPRYVSKEHFDAHLTGEWVVEERVFSEHSPELKPRSFILYLRQP